MSHRDSQVFQSDGHPLYIFQLHFNVAFLPEMEPGLVDSPSKRAQNTKDTDWSTSESMKKLDVELSELTELTSIEARWGVGDVFWSVFLTLRPFGPSAQTRTTTKRRWPSEVASLGGKKQETTDWGDPPA